MTSPQQTILSDGLEAAVTRSTDGVSQDSQNLVQDQSPGLQIHRPSQSTGDADPSSLTPQAVSSTDRIQQSVCEHGHRIPGNDSQHGENQADEPQQMLDLGPPALETASQPSADSSHTALDEGAQPTEQPSPPDGPSGANTANSGSGCLVQDQDEGQLTPKPPISESLGLWACTIIAGGTAITLAVLGFLIFLWSGEGQAGGESATYVWRKIMLSETWPAQTVTICSLLLRTVAAAQAALCTSLVAALLLERRRLPLSKVVPVSIKRAVNDGPFSLVREVFSRKYLQPVLCLEMVLLLLVATVTFGIQFTSTVLLSGFDTTTLVEFPQQIRHNVLLSADAAVNSTINSYSQFPPSYALFGELETSNIPDPNLHGVSDTGVRLRSFVPFQQQQRTKLRAYSGPTFCERTQVMCMRPNMDARISLTKVTAELGTMPMTSISGTISYEETFKEATLNDSKICSSSQQFENTSQTVCLPQNFSCTLPLGDTLTIDPLPVISLCHLPAEVVGNSARNSPAGINEGNESTSIWSASANPWVYLTFSTNLSGIGVSEEMRAKENLSVPLVTPIAKSGEWKTYQVLPTMALNVSLCFARVQTEVYSVLMSSATDPKEPEVRWDPRHREDGVEPGQVFMGTTGSHLSGAERGILSISDFRYPDSVKVEDIDGSSQALWDGIAGFTGMFADQEGGSWIMCNVCAYIGWAIPPDIAGLFARTVHTTGRAGWAIQNFLTTYTESWYAQILPQFDVAADIDVTFSTQVRIPRHWGGLIATLVMVIVNLICVWAITVLYVVHTKYSRQGNVWHTVSQIMSDDTRLVLEQSNQAKDDEVEKRLKADDYLVFLGRPKGSKNVSVLRC